MNYKHLFLYFLICYWLVGCTSVPTEMVVAERIVETHPDSALNILQKLKPEKYQSNSNRALFGLLLFHALEKTDKKMQPDSVINFSISYFTKANDNIKLAGCYFYKGHKFKHEQQYADATGMYLKALDCLKNTKNYYLLGRIYSDMGDVYSFQSNFSEALKKYQSSLVCLNHSGDRIVAGFVLISIGRNYSLRKNRRVAQLYFKKAIYKMNDSILVGAAFQEMGINFHINKQLDSAQFYLRKSLQYPYRSTNYAIRNYCLADVMFDLEQYDEANKYATIALNYEAGFYTKKECYRILVNVAYLRKDIHQMGKYMILYQAYSDSVLQINTHTKIDVLENLHNTAQSTLKIKQNVILVISVLIIILILSIYFAIVLYKLNKIKKDQLNVSKHELTNNQKLYSESLSKNITDIRLLQTGIRKKASPPERDLLDKKIYQKALNLDNWDDFKLEMNHTFNNIVDKLVSKCPSITHKEITWCCMQLLDIPHADRMVLLEASSDSLYKLKQRLAHKLNLKSTKELNSYLINEINLTHQY